MKEKLTGRNVEGEWKKQEITIHYTNVQNKMNFQGILNLIQINSLTSINPTPKMIRFLKIKSTIS